VSPPQERQRLVLLLRAFRRPVSTTAVADALGATRARTLVRLRELERGGLASEAGRLLRRRAVSSVTGPRMLWSRDVLWVVG